MNMMYTLIAQVFVWICLTLSLKQRSSRISKTCFCFFPSLPHYSTLCTDNLVNQTIPGEPSLALLGFFSCPPPPPPSTVFISLHLFWSSGVISQTKCLSVHKGEMVNMFQRIHLSALLSLAAPCEWKRSSASQLAFQDLQAFQHLWQEKPSVCLYMCILRVCLNAFLPRGWVPSLLVDTSPLRSSMRRFRGERKLNFLPTCRVPSVCSRQIRMTYEKWKEVTGRGGKWRIVICIKIRKNKKAVSFRQIFVKRV